MIAGYILTGGQNRRMGGEKKLFLEYEGKPFYRHILSAFSMFPRTFLSVEAEEPYREVGLPMVVDIYPGIGPMGGIYAGLMSCFEDALFVVACDMPKVDQKTVRRVVRAYQETGKLTLVEANGRVQPLFGIYPRSMALLLESLIWERNYRMRELLELTDYVLVPLEEGSTAAENVNTREDYRKLLDRESV